MFFNVFLKQKKFSFFFDMIELNFKILLKKKQNLNILS